MSTRCSSSEDSRLTTTTATTAGEARSWRRSLATLLPAVAYDYGGGSALHCERCRLLGVATGQEEVRRRLAGSARRKIEGCTWADAICCVAAPTPIIRLSGGCCAHGTAPTRALQTSMVSCWMVVDDKRLISSCLSIVAEVATSPTTIVDATADGVAVSAATLRRLDRSIGIASCRVKPTLASVVVLTSHCSPSKTRTEYIPASKTLPLATVSRVRPAWKSRHGLLMDHGPRHSSVARHIPHSRLTRGHRCSGLLRMAYRKMFSLAHASLSGSSVTSSTTNCLLAFAMKCRSALRRFLKQK